MFTPSFSQRMANELHEAALPLVQDAHLRELLQCQAFFAWYAGAGAQDPRASSDAPAWLDQSLKLLEADNVER